MTKKNESNQTIHADSAKPAARGHRVRTAIRAGHNNPIYAAVVSKKGDGNKGEAPSGTNPLYKV
jgi:hypothetical protein